MEGGGRLSGRKIFFSKLVAHAPATGADPKAVYNAQGPHSWDSKSEHVTQMPIFPFLFSPQ